MKKTSIEKMRCFFLQLSFFPSFPFSQFYRTLLHNKMLNDVLLSSRLVTHSTFFHKALEKLSFQQFILFVVLIVTRKSFVLSMLSVQCSQCTSGCLEPQTAGLLPVFPKIIFRSKTVLTLIQCSLSSSLNGINNINISTFPFFALHWRYTFQLLPLSVRRFY